MEEKSTRKFSNMDWFILAVIMVLVFVAGLLFGEGDVISQRTSQVSVNETYLYNLGYTQGHNDVLSSFPAQSSEPSITQSDVINQIMEALGTASKVDLQVHGDKETGKSTIALNIEFTQPTYYLPR